jgi:hypothetical protein
MIRIDDPYLQRLAEIESGNNPRAQNPKSSAKGYFQFINSTGREVGLVGQGFDYRGNPEKELAAAKQFTDKNRQILAQGLGRDPTPGELYLAHQQGAGGALNILSNPDAKAVDTVGADAVKLNGGNENMTNAEFARKWITKFEGENVATDDLTPEEQEELAQLEAEFGQQESQGDDLTPEEQQELAALEAELEGGEQGQKPKDEGYIAEDPTAGDYARTAFDQGMQGATFGFADEITDSIGALIASRMTGISYTDLLKEARETTKARLSEQQQEMPGTSILSNVAGGALTGAAGATTKAGSAIANSLRTGNLPARVIKSAATGAASGAAYGAGTAQEGERAEGAGAGAALGATVGAAVPAVASAARSVKDAVVPKIDDAIKPLAQRARDFGIPLRADQVAPTRVRKTVQKVSQELPFSGVDKFEDTQRQAFTKAVAKTIGQDSADLGPDIINKFLDDASKKFGDVLSSGPIKASKDIAVRLDEITDDASKTLDDNLLPSVRRTVEEVKKIFQISENSSRQNSVKAAQAAIANGRKEIGVIQDDLRSIQDIIKTLEDEVRGLAKISNQQLGIWRRKTINKTADSALTLNNARNLQKKTQTALQEKLKEITKNEDIIKSLSGPIEIEPKKIATLRSNLIRRASRAQGGAKHYIGEIVEVLDEEIGKSLSPEKMKLFEQARREWRNFKTIEPLLEESTDGQINPVKLMNRVKASKYIKASRKTVGEDDLVDLARIGKEFLPKSGGSDTFQKSAFTLGAGSILAYQNPLIALKVGGGLAANRAMQSGVNQNQRLIDMALRNAGQKALPRSLPLNPLIAATANQ